MPGGPTDCKDRVWVSSRVYLWRPRGAGLVTYGGAGQRLLYEGRRVGMGLGVENPREQQLRALGVGR